MKEAQPQLYSEELLFQVESSAYFQNSLSFRSLTITAKTLQHSAAWRALFNGDQLNRSAERARGSRPITEQTGVPGWERKRGKQSRGRDIHVGKLHYRNVWFNNRNGSGQYIRSKCQAGILGCLMQSWEEQRVWVKWGFSWYTGLHFKYTWGPLWGPKHTVDDKLSVPFWNLKF